jgi:hypothetical protein
MEKLKLGDARVSASVLSMVNNIKGQQPEHEYGQQPEHKPEQHPQSRFLLESPFSAAGPSDYVSTHGTLVSRSKGNGDSHD